MKKITSCFVFIFIISGILFQLSAQDKVVKIFGKVTDTAGTPIAEALILVTDTIIMPLHAERQDFNFDTMYSKIDGTFEKDVTVKSTAITITYLASKDEYQPTFGVKVFLGLRVDLGTIVLKKQGVVDPIPVFIKGKVIDSISSEPIEEALVILQSSVNFTEPPESVYTDENGLFSHTMEIDTSAGGPIGTFIGGAVSKAKYQAKLVSKKVTSDTVDLGTILLEKVDESIQFIIPQLFMKQRPDNMRVYTIKGQLLYKGPVVNLEKLKDVNISLSRPLIISFMHNNTELYKTKYMSVK